MTTRGQVLERRDVAAGVSLADPLAAGGPRFLEGLAVPYGTPTRLAPWAEEVIAPGAFKKSVQEAARDLPLLLHHDARDWPIGAARGWKHKPDGLFGSWEMDDSDRAAEAVRLAERGFLTGLSVGFMPLREESEDIDPREHDGVEVRYVVHEARLVEVSLVATPAYQDAGVVAVRSTGRALDRPRPRPRLTAARAWLQAAR